MYLYVEMWNAKPAWLGLAQPAREAFMKKVDDFLGTIIGQDRQVYGCCVNDGDTAPRAGYTYLVVWKLKDKAAVKAIADGTAAVGFYDYFSQVNIGGEQVGPDELVAALLSL